MPVFRIHYDENEITDAQFSALNEYLLKESVRIFEVPLEHMSLFSFPYGKHHYGTSTLEIYCSASIGLYTNDVRTPQEQRVIWAKQLSDSLKQYRVEKDFNFTAVLTVQIEDWLFEFIE